MNRRLLASFFSTLPRTQVVPGTCSPQSTPTPVHSTDAGKEDPAHGGDLSPDYKACSMGQSQSPIDLTNPVLRDVPNLVFHYQPSKVNIVNNGYTIQVDYHSGSQAALDGARQHHRSPILANVVYAKMRE